MNRNAWKRKLLNRITGTLSAGLLAFSCVFLNVNAEPGGSITNTSSLGTVSITLTELDSSSKEFIDHQTVNPGQNLDLNAKITNNANAAWIRARAEFSSEKPMEGLDESMIIMSTDPNWIKRGDYYYYRKPLKTSQEVSFTKGLSIPETWTEAYANHVFKVIIRADAVQYDNFVPNFNSNDPWFGTVIEASINDKFIAKVDSSSIFRITYKGGTEEIVHNVDNFFRNFNTFMPGDHLADYLTCTNNYKYPVTMYMSAKNQIDTELAKKIYLEMYTDAGTLYKGSLYDAVFSNKELFYLKSGESKKLFFTLDVDSSVTNKYTAEELRKIVCNWVFSAKVHSPGKNPANTADPYEMTLTLTMFVGSVVLAIWMSLLLKDGKNEG